MKNKVRVPKDRTAAPSGPQVQTVRLDQVTTIVRGVNQLDSAVAANTALTRLITDYFVHFSSSPNRRACDGLETEFCLGLSILAETISGDVEKARNEIDKSIIPLLRTAADEERQEVAS